MTSLRTVAWFAFLVLPLLACGPSGSGGTSDPADTGGNEGGEPADETPAGDDGGLDEVGTTEGDTTTATVGAGGGVLVGRDGLVTLAFPEAALAQDTTVVLTVTDQAPGDDPPAHIGPVVAISLDPPPDPTLDFGALLTFPTVDGDSPDRIAKLLTLPELGTVQSDDGTTTRPSEVWVPLGFARSDEAGHAAAVLGGFSTYGANAGWDGSCVPTAEQLAPPATPEGYVYMGVKVFIDNSMDPELSTLPPLFPPHEPSHINVLSSKSVSENSVVVCTISVEHVFVPEGTVDPECVPSHEFMSCPPPDPGYAFVGYDLVLNGVLLKTTVDLERPEKPTDVNHISSETTVEDGVVVCDFILRCLYEPLPEGGGDTLDVWEESDATLPPDDAGSSGGPDVGPAVTGEWEPLDDEFDWETVFGELPPPGDGDPEYTPEPYYWSMYRYTKADSSQIGHSSPFILYIDFMLAQGEVGATFLQIEGADHYGIATNAEIQQWGDEGQASVVLRFDQAPGSADFVGEHTLVVALAGSDGQGGWDPALVSDTLDIPVDIAEPAGH